MTNLFKSRVIENIGNILTSKSIFYLSKIGEFKGRQILYSNQQAELLEKLQITAITNGTLFSSSIDKILIDKNRFDELFSELDDPSSSLESEIIRYIKVTNIINNHYESIEISPNILLQFHMNLFNQSKDICGKWKLNNKPIESKSVNSYTYITFPTIPYDEVEEKINMLCSMYTSDINKDYAIDLILIALFILDFLCIHPFEKGNGRLSRLITNLLLNKQGYYVSKYCSLEEFIIKRTPEYFYCLNISSQGWHESAHDPSLWVEYFLRMIYESYLKLDNEIFIIKQKKGAKTKQVKLIIEKLGNNFTVSEVASRCPGISRPTVNKVLQELRDEGFVKPKSLGRDAVWEKC